MTSRPKKVSLGDERLGVRRAGALGYGFAVAVVGIFVIGVFLAGAAGVAVRSDTGCGACHSMDPYLEAAELSVHAAVPCSECHASVGVTGVFTDGFRALGWIGGGSPVGSTVGNPRCLECHADIADGVVESRGIAVRHSDFLEVDCGECHAGIAHAVESRWYRVLEMDDCMSCHRSSATNPDMCGQCHVPTEGGADRREGPTAWRASHGSGWRSAHGMGSLDGCISCHEPDFCTDCHEVRVPHPTTWLTTHGSETRETGVDGCPTCHDADWCSSCHGIEMPHPAGFVAVHGSEAVDRTEETCYRCHDVTSCDLCHFKSSHPDVPGVGMGHDAS